VWAKESVDQEVKSEETRREREATTTASVMLDLRNSAEQELGRGSFGQERDGWDGESWGQKWWMMMAVPARTWSSVAAALSG
jgi:hypothetical protein